MSSCPCLLSLPNCVVISALSQITRLSQRPRGRGRTLTVEAASLNLPPIVNGAVNVPSSADDVAFGEDADEMLTGKAVWRRATDTEDGKNMDIQVSQLDDLCVARHPRPSCRLRCAESGRLLLLGLAAGGCIQRL